MRLFTLFVFLVFSHYAYSQTTYISKQNGAWNKKTTWLVNNKPANNFPGTNARVIVNHAVNLTHKKSKYAHKQDIIVNAGATLTLETKNFEFTGDSLVVIGTLSIREKPNNAKSNGDLLLQKQCGTCSQAQLEAASVLSIATTGMLDVGDDLLINGSSKLLIDNSCGAVVVGDDIYFRGNRGVAGGAGSIVFNDKLRVWKEQGSRLVELKTDQEKELQLATQLDPGFFLYRSITDCENQLNAIPNYEALSLPVEYLSFQATATEVGILVEWVTAQESENDYFVVERAIQGLDFQTVAQESGVGYSQSPQAYQYLDNYTGTGEILYRLRQVDYDGQSSLSPIFSVWVEELLTQDVEDLMIFPNPANYDLQVPSLRLAGFPVESSVHLFIMDLQGKQVAPPISEKLNAQGRLLLPLTQRLTAGSYIIRVVTGGKFYYQKLLVH